MTNSPRLTKSEALDLYGRNGAALARDLGTSRQYISKLSDGELPEWIDLKLRFVLHPQRFVPEVMASLPQGESV